MRLNVELSVTGAKEFSQAMERLDLETRKQVEAKLAEWAEALRAKAVQLAPEKTGYLRSTIYAKFEQGQVQVGADADYAASVEFGTRHAAARPFLQPALEAQLPQLEPALLKALEAAKVEAGL
jgi:HK97 gp10 family phage protein